MKQVALSANMVILTTRNKELCLYSNYTNGCQNRITLGFNEDGLLLHMTDLFDLETRLRPTSKCRIDIYFPRNCALRISEAIVKNLGKPLPASAFSCSAAQSANKGETSVPVIRKAFRGSYSNLFLFAGGSYFQSTTPKQALFFDGEQPRENFNFMKEDEFHLGIQADDSLFRVSFDPALRSSVAPFDSRAHGVSAGLLFVRLSADDARRMAWAIREICG